MSRMWERAEQAAEYVDTMRVAIIRILRDFAEVIRWIEFCPCLTKPTKDGIDNFFVDYGVQNEPRPRHGAVRDAKSRCTSRFCCSVRERSYPRKVIKVIKGHRGHRRCFTFPFER